MYIKQIITNTLIFLFLFLCLHFTLHSGNLINIKAKCIRVIDGDTIIFEYYSLPIKVRLKYVDAYETRKSKHLEKQKEITKLSEQEILLLGELASKLAKSLIKENHIYCIQIDKDNPTGFYGRYIGTVYITDECKGLTLSHILLEANLAIPIKLYTKSNKNKQNNLNR